MLPPWLAQIRELYQSDAARQFVLYGNIDDVFEQRGELVRLPELLQRQLLGSFDVVVHYEVGVGATVLRGSEHLASWRGDLSAVQSPREAIALLRHLALYLENLLSGQTRRSSVGLIVSHAQLAAPADGSRMNQDVNACAAIMRAWSRPSLDPGATLVSFLLVRNLADLNGLVVTNPETAAIEAPLPTAEELSDELTRDPSYAPALEGAAPPASLAVQLAGLTRLSLVQALRRESRAKRPLTGASLVALRKSLVERQASGAGSQLIEFIVSDKTLDQFEGQPHLVELLRQDLALLRRGATHLCPMGYLLAAPVGCGKNYLVECLAGEAGIPVVVINNFRDRWVGSTEGNVESIFRLIRSLGQCYVFVDEADQTLGKRDAGSGDSQVDSRVYSMFATYMSDQRNRGRIIWILASSRPDKIEVDFKRPGRVDSKLPIFPALTRAAGYRLIHALARRAKITLPESPAKALQVPDLLTPSAANNIVISLGRAMALDPGLKPAQALKQALATYAPPVPLSRLTFQMTLAMAEATDARLIPDEARAMIAAYPPADR
jgi:hypothetical protein